MFKTAIVHFSFETSFLGLRRVRVLADFGARFGESESLSIPDARRKRPVHHGSALLGTSSSSSGSPAGERKRRPIPFGATTQNTIGRPIAGMSARAVVSSSRDKAGRPTGW